MIHSLWPSIAVALALLVGGCSSSGFNVRLPPPEVSHLDVAGKQAQVDSVKSTLKVFHATARDLRQRDSLDARTQLAAEFKRYYTLQVQPLVEDFESGNSLQTRLEIAQLQLLGGQVFLELQQNWQLYKLLRDMRQRYGDQPDVLNASIDRNDIGYGTIGDGMRSLQERKAGRSLAP